MHITVKLFARAKELAGEETLALSVPEGCTVGLAKAALVSQFPVLQPLNSVLLVAVNGNYATDATRLTDGCELACFPPVSGG